MTHQQPPAPAQPCERTLDDSATAVAAELAAVLVGRIGVVLLRGDDRLDPALGQLGTQLVAVVSPVQHQPVRIRPRVTQALQSGEAT